jgi:hypothetical protein
MKVDHQKVLNWLSQKGIGNIECSCCGKCDWGIEQDLMHIFPYTGQNLLIGSDHFLTYVVLICLNCPNIKLFKAEAMGNVFQDSPSTGAASPTPGSATPLLGGDDTSG